MNASEKLTMDRDDLTMVLFVCADTTEAHDIRTEEDHPEHKKLFYEHAGIKIILLKVDKSEGVLCFICLFHKW